MVVSSREIGEVFERFLCLARRREDGFGIALEDIEPVRNIGGVVGAWFAGDSESRASECRPYLRHQRLHRIRIISEALAHVPAEAVRRSRPMSQFVAED